MVDNSHAINDRKLKAKDDINCWILKTKEDNHGILSPRWKSFKAEKVIAIGWEVPPDKWITKNEIASSIRSYDADRGDGYVSRAAYTTCRFLFDMKKHDKVVLCDGYNSTQRLVKIYALAEVSGVPRYEANSRWWKIKRDAKITEVEKDVPRTDLSEILGLGTCMLTIHTLTIEKFSKLQSYLGIS